MVPGRVAVAGRDAPDVLGAEGLVHSAVAHGRHLGVNGEQVVEGIAVVSGHDDEGKPVPVGRAVRVDQGVAAVVGLLTPDLGRAFGKRVTALGPGLAVVRTQGGQAAFEQADRHPVRTFGRS